MRLLPFRRPEVLPAGLAIGAGEVRLAQLSSRQARLPWVALAHRPLPTAARPAGRADSIDLIRAAAELARQMLDDGQVLGRRVVAALPDAIVHIRTLRVAATDSREIPSRDLLRREASLLFPFDLAQARLQFIHAGLTRHGTELWHEVIAAASLARQIESFVGELDRVGLEVESVDLAPSAMYRGLAWHCEDPAAVHAIVHVGEQNTHVVIGAGSAVRFIKSLAPGGAASLNDAVSRRLGITAEEAAQLRARLNHPAATVAGAVDREPVRKAVWQACRAEVETLAGEVALCLRYYRVAFRGAQPQRLTLTGPEAANPQLRSMLAVTGLTVEAANPFDGFDLSSASPAHLPAHSTAQWALPMGLALRSLSKAPAALAA